MKVDYYQQLPFAHMSLEKAKIIGVGIGAAGTLEAIKHFGAEVGAHAVAGAGLEFIKHLVKL